MVWFKKVPIHKVNIFVSEDDIVDVMITLGRLRSLDLVETGQDEGWDTGRGGHWAQVADQYSSLVRRMENLIDSLGLSRQEAAEPENLDPDSDAGSLRGEIDQIQDHLNDWQERRQQAEHSLKQLDLAVQGFRVLAPLDFPMEEFCQSEHVHLVFGALPKQSIASLNLALSPIPFAIIPFAERKDSTYVYAASAQDDAPILDRALRSAFFDPLVLPEDALGRPGELVDQFEKRFREAEDLLEDLKAERARLASERGPSLLRGWRRARADAKIAETISHLERHDRTYLIAGWVGDKELERLVAGLRQLALLVTVVETKAVSRAPDQSRSFLAALGR
jgi:vacuolar-type H+-ATPase subunit I/STV1